MSDDFFPGDVCEASETGDLTALRQLLDAHPEWVNWRDSGGGTPLHYAANVAVLRLLVDRGGEIGSRNGSGRTPLHIAARSGESDSVLFILGMGADINASDRYGRTPLHEAARNGNIHVVRMLVEQGAEPNRVDDRGDSPLMSIGGTPEERNLIAEALLNAGTRLNLNSAMKIGNYDYVLERITGPKAMMKSIPLRFLTTCSLRPFVQDRSKLSAFY